MSVPSFIRIERGSDGGPRLQTLKGAFSYSKKSEYQCFEVCYPGTSSCASKLLLLQCKVVKPKCLCQVSLGLKEVQMEAHDFKLIKVPLFSRKSVNINVSLSAAPKLALVPASRYYCDVNWSNHNVCAKFH